jgi:hypothetical protein
VAELDEFIHLATAGPLSARCLARRYVVSMLCVSTSPFAAPLPPAGVTLDTLTCTHLPIHKLPNLSPASSGGSHTSSKLNSYSYLMAPNKPAKARIPPKSTKAGQSGTVLGSLKSSVRSLNVNAPLTI